MTTNFKKVAAMNVAFGNPKGNPSSIDPGRLRSQIKNIFHEYCELLVAAGANPATVQSFRQAESGVIFDREIDLEGMRDALCDGHVFGYGAHHLMGLDADQDMAEVVGAVMTRFIKDDEDKQATIALHAAKGVTQVYFEGEYPMMVMKSLVDQPDAPKGKFLKSASYKEPRFTKLD